MSPNLKAKFEVMQGNIIRLKKIRDLLRSRPMTPIENDIAEEIRRLRMRFAFFADQESTFSDDDADFLLEQMHRKILTINQCLYNIGVNENGIRNGQG